MHWRRKWQPTPVFLPGESQGWGSLLGCGLWGRKESDTTEATAAAASHASKVTLKILQARLQQYVNHELPDVQTGFRKGRGTTDQTANIHWIIEKQESSRKTSISALLTMPKPLTVWITIHCGKFWKRWEYQTIDLPLEQPVYMSESNS